MQRAVGSIAARVIQQTALGTLFKFVKERTLQLVENVEIDGALVAYSNDCFVQGVQHHHGSQFLTAVMCRWLSFSRFESGGLPRKSSSRGSVHDHFAGDGHARPSELLGLEQKDRVPSLVRLLPRCSIVVLACETGVSTETGVRILMNQR